MNDAQAITDYVTVLGQCAALAYTRHTTHRFRGGAHDNRGSEAWRPQSMKLSL